MLFSVYSDLLIGITIGLLCTIFFLANFPYISVISAPKESNIKKGKHAFRLTICLNIAFIVSSYIATTNIVWICLAVLTVSSTTIGDSVQRAISRIAGTLIGGIIGAIIANNLFKIYPTSLYLCYPLIFISFI